jgi:hypothetical protein
MELNTNNHSECAEHWARGGIVTGKLIPKLVQSTDEEQIKRMKLVEDLIVNHPEEVDSCDCFYAYEGYMYMLVNDKHKTFLWEID